MSLTLILAACLLAAPARSENPCDAAAGVCRAPAAKPGGQSYNWGQGDPLILHTAFTKTADGAKKEHWAKDNQGFFSKLTGQDPKIEAKVELSKDYLVLDSPAIADKDENGDPVVKIGKAALDSTQSEAEMAFLMGHEVHHTLVQERKKSCLKRGVKKLGSSSRVKGSSELTKYRVDLEHEADSYGQRYAANGGYSPLAAVDAIRHVGDLGEALGADASADDDHASTSERESQLQAYGKGELFEAKCPWGEE